MPDYRNFVVEEKLKNGHQVLLRAIQPDDKRALLSGFASFSDRSRQMRFFGPKSDVSDQELKYYTEIDHVKHVALVAVVRGNGDERVIGGGRYMAFDTPDQQVNAEVAFAVVDEFQGLGLASLVFKYLVDIARQNGIAKFKAEVLVNNRAMLNLLEHSGLTMQRSVDSGVVNVTLDLG